MWRAKPTARELARCVAGFLTDEKRVREIAANPGLEAVMKATTGTHLLIAFDATGIDEAFATLTRVRRRAGA